MEELPKFHTVKNIYHRDEPPPAPVVNVKVRLFLELTAPFLGYLTLAYIAIKYLGV